MPRKRVAIIGSGCAGLGAAWALKDSNYDVHVFEKDSRLGGHTNTQPFRSKTGSSLPVDTGFIVMNSATYPNFLNFLKAVQVDPVTTPMTFAVSRDHGKFEWSGEGKGVFAQRRNLFRLRHWHMIFDIIRFNQYALDLLDEENDEAQNLTIGEYLKKYGYSQAFCDDYLIPMAAAVWSTSPDKATLEFPAQTLIRFMWNHHLLSTLATRPDWLTIPGGSQRYIDAVVDAMGNQLHLHTSSPVISVVRPDLGSDEGVRVIWADEASPGQSRSEEIFDHAIFACHGDQILPILSQNADPLDPVADTKMRRSGHTNGSISSPHETENNNVSTHETDILSTFQTTENVCYLHSDLSLMPTRRQTWSSWNYLITSQPSQHKHPAGVSLTYDMNILQHISEEIHGPVLVTMNPGHAPKPELTQGRYIYRHPLYTVDAVRAQQRLEGIQNHRGVSYCGAWTKYGFHEDGFSSGLKVAMDHLGAKLPFEFKDSTHSRGHRTKLNALDYLLRVVLSMILVVVQFLAYLVELPALSSLVHISEHCGMSILDNLEKSGVLT